LTQDLCLPNLFPFRSLRGAIRDDAAGWDGMRSRAGDLVNHRIGVTEIHPGMKAPCQELADGRLPLVCSRRLSEKRGRDGKMPPAERRKARVPWRQGAHLSADYGSAKRRSAPLGFPRDEGRKPDDRRNPRRDKQQGRRSFALSLALSVMPALAAKLAQAA
jgi:hypothetical protein